MSMVERVAASMWKDRARKNHCIPNPWSETPENIKVELRAYARAAIKALRDPTDEMLLYASSVGPVFIDGVEDVDETNKEIWQAMIDAALNEEMDNG